jgi:AraC family transcriptional regulator
MKTTKLLVKNMVCPRCISSVESILKSQNISFSNVSLGEINLTEPISLLQRNNLNKELERVGFEIIETKLNSIIEKIKLSVTAYINNLHFENKLKLSAFIVEKLPYDYSYLSDLFSSVEGITIEHYFINQRIEKVKELLVYDQLTLTEISYKTGFSSVHHLSTQFKKVTGLSPSHFKKIGLEKSKSIKC